MPDTLAKEINADMEKDSTKLKARNTDEEGWFTFFGTENVDKFATYDDYLTNQATLSADGRDNMLEQYLLIITAVITV
ncbi:MULTISPECIES: hypothetical protein [unclassified Mucilaginibacter]|uniref:hypothetical protein n=1 Tax=unclassified Mucilaginibacter TaxID=2617802 RepID=UPI002AC9846F|nr:MULTISPECIES: hypothetical protein [unclassified Mucilaginibacter]MEB0262324.1 hypothetical protein [Mucilaginibacter sp. 10I4]MEB0279971.1 hypothetical protein [Mucilaginibacter sp. 10B2]MEB0301787.1 hypothetical protein [Mucilaginibacter sp. 5C4]WPX21929.1 hypothetical protein RHM67_11595 [Mucilaginibacter sp. 5C4]